MLKLNGAQSQFLLVHGRTGRHIRELGVWHFMPHLTFCSRSSYCDTEVFRPQFVSVIGYMCTARLSCWILSKAGYLWGERVRRVISAPWWGFGNFCGVLPQQGWRGLLPTRPSLLPYHLWKSLWGCVFSPFQTVVGISFLQIQHQSHHILL